MNRRMELTLVSLACVALLTGCASTMHKAAMTGDVASLQNMVEKGKNVEKLSYAYVYGYAVKTTPLIAATLGEQEDACKILIKGGAKVNRAHKVIAKSPDGKIYRFKGEPIVAATVIGNKQLVELFLDNGAIVNENPKVSWATAMLSHKAADYFVKTDEKKALGFYKQAAVFYPKAAKEIKHQDGSKVYGGLVGMIEDNYYSPEHLSEDFDANGRMCENIVKLYGKGDKPLAACVKEAKSRTY